MAEWFNDPHQFRHVVLTPSQMYREFVIVGYKYDYSVPGTNPPRFNVNKVEEGQIFSLDDTRGRTWLLKMIRHNPTYIIIKSTPETASNTPPPPRQQAPTQQQATTQDSQPATIEEQNQQPLVEQPAVEEQSTGEEKINKLIAAINDSSIVVPDGFDADVFTYNDKAGQKVTMKWDGTQWAAVPQSGWQWPQNMIGTLSRRPGTGTPYVRGSGLWSDELLKCVNKRFL